MNGGKDRLIGSSVLDAVQEVSFLGTVNSVNDSSGDTTEKVPSLSRSRDQNVVQCTILVPDREGRPAVDPQKCAATRVFEPAFSVARRRGESLGYGSRNYERRAR